MAELPATPVNVKPPLPPQFDIELVAWVNELGALGVVIVIIVPVIEQLGILALRIPIVFPPAVKPLLTLVVTHVAALSNVYS